MLIDLLAKSISAGEKREKRLSESTKKTAAATKPAAMAKTLTPVKKDGLIKRSVLKIGDKLHGMFGSTTNVTDASTPVELLGKIYDQLQLMQEDKKLNDELRNNSLEEEEHLKDKRNQEIIAALTGRKTTGKKSGKGKQPNRQTRREQAKRRKEREVAQEQGIGGRPASIGNPPKPTVSTAKPNVPTPKPAATSATPTTGTAATAASAAPTVAKVAGATILATAAVGIGAAESGGNYDISFGDRVEKGQIINKSGVKTPEQWSGGRKLSDMTLKEVMEFQDYRNSVNPGSNAVGKYQFMKTTLFGQNGKGGIVQQAAGVTMNDKFDGKTQEKLYAVYHNNNLVAMQKMNVPQTPGYEYMAHYVGVGGAAAVHEAIAKNPNMVVVDAIKMKYPTTNVEKLTRNNKELGTIKVAEFEGILAKRVSGSGTAAPHSTNSTGNDVNARSVELAQRKKDLNAQQAVSNQQNTAFVNNQTSQTDVKTKPANDKNPMLEKINNGK